MNIETVIKLNRFKPRPYQLPILDAIENKGYLRVLAILPRRAGKDITAFNLMIRMALKKIGVYYYIFPTYNMGRKILWDNITTEGVRVLDFLPAELIDSKQEQQMRIRLKNGSIIQIVGSDDYDKTLVGTNPRGVVFSEYALQDPRAYMYVRPILTANLGWALFISTPRGANHLHELWEIARHNPQDWFAYKLTVEETQHISLFEIEKERASGEMSEDLIQQEYYCSFEMGIEGSYYNKYLDKMKLDGRIGQVPWEPSFKVHTAWDLGVHDTTEIIMFQVIGQVVRIIDHYSNNDKGLDHYAKILDQKTYTYGKHIAPHDIKVRELGATGGMSRLERARHLGLNFTVAPDLSIEDGIEAVRATFSKVWIDEKKCATLLKALENYRREYDSKKKVYKTHPLHNWASNASDAMRYLAISLSKTRDGLSPEDLDKRYQEAVYGKNANMPAIFRDDLPGY